MVIKPNVVVFKTNAYIEEFESKSGFKLERAGKDWSNYVKLTVVVLDEVPFFKLVANNLLCSSETKNDKSSETNNEIVKPKLLARSAVLLETR